MEKKRFAIFPGSMGVVACACQIFPLEDINPGWWGSPVWITSTEEDVSIFVDLINDLRTEPRQQEFQFRADPR